MGSRMKKELKIILVSLAAGLALAALAGAYTFVYSDTVQRGIADNVLRFHVNAHSDNPCDQALKDEVRTAVLASLEGVLTDGVSLEKAREYIYTRLDSITDTAQAVVTEGGFAHGVTAEITTRFFPTTIYGDIVFPPGMYETLTLSIGNGTGRNWWCLMFPPLCYIEMTGTAHTRNLLEENVPGPGFALLTHQQSEAAPGVTVRFRIVEWWQNRRNGAAQPPRNDLRQAGTIAD